jgi:hypothetical protein
LAHHPVGAVAIFKARQLPLMLKKPTPVEYEISKTGIWHRPTKERFIAHRRKPADGVWKDGHSLTAIDYDVDAVRQMGRTLWAMHIAERKRGR